MPTLDDLVAEVESLLYGYTAANDQLTSLSTSIDATATTIPVDDSSQSARGFVEICSTAGYELVAIKGRDTNANTLTAHPWGRGQGGTTALAHNAGARIAYDPQFPRHRIKNAINEALAGLTPDLYGVGIDESQTIDALKTVYTVPAVADGILDVQVSRLDGTTYWDRVRRYKYDLAKQTLSLFSRNWPTTTLRIVYRKPITQLANPTDTLTSTGLDDSARDVVVLGALYRLQAGIPTQRVQTATMSSQAMAVTVPPDSVGNLVRMTMASYQLAVQREKAKLQARYPSHLYSTQ